MTENYIQSILQQYILPHSFYSVQEFASVKRSQLHDIYVRKMMFP